MAPLAGWMARAGYTVLGYDDNLQEHVRQFLAGSGVELDDFLLTEQISQFDKVVYSSAIKADHSLLAAASKAGLELLRRGEMLAEIAEMKRLVAIVGSHGKTTTTGMVAHAIQHCKAGINYIVGGFFNDPSLPPSHFSDSDWLVAEIDESDGTIDRFSPEITVLLNADWDHADRYLTREDLDETFQNLIKRTKSCVLLPSDESLIEKFKSNDNVGGLTFGQTGDFQSTLEAGGFLSLSGNFEANKVKIPEGNRIYSINGTAALAVLELLAVQWPADVFSSFSGMSRRQAVLHDDSSLTIIEDYAHHPTEIKALLEGLRAKRPGHEFVVVFQPHRYSRTKQFKGEFVNVLQEADQLFLLPVYAAYEPVIGGGTIDALLDVFGSDLPQVLAMDPEGAGQLAGSIREGPTTLVFVGAGDINLFAGMFTSMYQNDLDMDLAWSGFLQGRLSSECILKQAEPLAKKTTMRVGGTARFYAEPGNLSDLRMLLSAAKLFNLETFCLGRGSNILVSDEGFQGLVIRFSSAAWRRVKILGDGRIWAAAGVRLKELCGQAAKIGLTGFEFLEGIPGTVGGALRMNAGAMGKWMFDVVEQVQLLDETSKLQSLPKSSFHVEYRKVEEISRGIALGAVLKSAEVEEERSIRGRMDSYSNLRKSSQPRDPSAGCIFKNPEGNHAGKLIDINGLKGMRVGGAEVSSMHGNFIVNRGGASARDVMELVQQVRERIYEKSGYLLEPEVLLLGRSWDTVLSETNPVINE